MRRSIIISCFAVEPGFTLVIHWDTLPQTFLLDTNECRDIMCCIRWGGMLLDCQQNNMLLRSVSELCVFLIFSRFCCNFHFLGGFINMLPCVSDRNSPKAQYGEEHQSLSHSGKLMMKYFYSNERQQCFS